MSSSLFSGITSGLSSTYSILANASSGNVTLQNIASARSNTTYANTLNQSFASYIQTNFSNLDKNKDGNLSSAELSELTNAISASGLTAAQLSQLGTASGLSSNTLNQVMEHFSQIDKNGDGKVTAAEITNYKLTSEMDKKKTEFANKAAANQSIFYGSENSSETNSSSMLDYRNWNNGDSSNSSSS